LLEAAPPRVEEYSRHNSANEQPSAQSNGGGKCAAREAMREDCDRGQDARRAPQICSEKGRSDLEESGVLKTESSKRTFLRCGFALFFESSMLINGEHSQNNHLYSGEQGFEFANLRSAATLRLQSESR